MAETIDHEVSFTILLTHIPKFAVGDVICNIYPTTPHTGTVYEVTATGYVVHDFTGGTFSFGFGAESEYELCAPPDPCAGVTCPNICLGTSLYGQVCLNGVCVTNTLIEANSPTCRAEGQLVSRDVPVGPIPHGGTFDIDASVKNIGGTSGTFRVDMFLDGTRVQASTTFTIAAGVTSSDKIAAEIAPSSGSSMSIQLKCIRIS